jgi:hypothetical protein
MIQSIKIYIAGHNGMVEAPFGVTVNKGYTNLVGASSKSWI